MHEECTTKRWFVIECATNSVCDQWERYDTQEYKSFREAQQRSWNLARAEGEYYDYEQDPTTKTIHGFRVREVVANITTKTIVEHLV